MIFLDRNAPEPYYRQIYHQIIEAIILGVYPEGMRLPSIRAHASLLNVSRNTIALAYQHLVSEGYLEPRPNSGFFVSKINHLPLPPEASSEESLSALAAKASNSENECFFRYDFNYGNADPSIFPTATWANIARKIYFENDISEAFCYNDSQGIYQLRHRIALMMAERCGASVAPEQITIHPRARFALTAVAQLFNPQTDTFMIEDPGFHEAAAAFTDAGFTVEALPVLGTKSDAFARLEAIKPKVIYLTPSNQYPTNQVMDLKTRKDFLEWAYNNNAYIIEDIYCNEFRYGLSAHPSLYTLDKLERVILTGTFSKTFSPALCISYLVFPKTLIGKWLSSNTMHPPVSWQTQATLAMFLEEYGTRHINRLRTSFQKKHDTLIDVLEKEMGNNIEFLDHRAGLHLLIRTTDNKTEKELINLAAQHNIRVYPTNHYWLNGAPKSWDYILLGFSSIALEDIEPGIKALAHAWDIQNTA